MKKTVTINISGIIFHIDDDAYEKLSRYMNTIKSHFTDSDGREEIIGDIESRIAEILQGKMIENKQVITIEDIDDIISLMGEPSEFDGSAETRPEYEYRDYEKRRQKRLYRDPDNKMIGGVASGLAAYFNTDPVWFRLIFVVSLFISGIGFIAYIIFWIVVPEAITTAEKLEMRGEPVNISNIEKSIREEFDNLKTKINDFTDQAKQTYKKKSAGHKTVFDNILNIFVTTFSIIFKVILVVVGISLIISALFMIIGFLGLVFGFNSFSFFENGELYSFSIPMFLNMIFGFHIQSVLVIISCSLIFGIPLLALIYLGIRLLFGSKARIKFFGTTAFAFWLVGIIIALFIGWRVGIDFRHTARITDEYKIMKNNKVVYFKTTNQKELSYRNNTVELFDGPWKAVLDYDNYKIYAVPYIRFKKSNTENVFLEVTTLAKGSSRTKARERARNCIYEVKSTDSSFILDTYYTLPDNETFRAQEVKIIIWLPEGQVVRFSENMEELFDNNPNYSLHYHDYSGNTYIMTGDGLKPYFTTKEKNDAEQDISQIIKKNHFSPSPVTKTFGFIPLPFIGF